MHLAQAWHYLVPVYRYASVTWWHGRVVGTPVNTELSIDLCCHWILDWLPSQHMCFTVISPTDQCWKQKISWQLALCVSGLSKVVQYELKMTDEVEKSSTSAWLQHCKSAEDVILRPQMHIAAYNYTLIIIILRIYLSLKIYTNPQKCTMRGHLITNIDSQLRPITVIGHWAQTSKSHVLSVEAWGWLHPRPSLIWEQIAA